MGCYVDRELTFGSFGTDVSCLQEHLQTENLYEGKLTGHYGTLTRDAVTAWQRKNHVRRGVSAGVFDLNTRKAYARKYDLPQPDDTRMSEIESDDQGSHRVCLDVCSDFNGFQDCKTRCVPSLSSSRETAKGERMSSPPHSSNTLVISNDNDAKYHACRSACQVSYGVSCDRAYPMTAPDGQNNFTNCLRSLQDECESLCSKYKYARGDKGRL